MSIVFSIQGEHADSGGVGHVLDLSAASHLVASRWPGSQVNDGGVALQDALQHGRRGDSLHHVGGDVPQGFAGMRLIALNNDTEVVKSLSIGGKRSVPPGRGVRNWLMLCICGVTSPGSTVAGVGRDWLRGGRQGNRFVGGVRR